MAKSVWMGIAFLFSILSLAGSHPMDREREELLELLEEPAARALEYYRLSKVSKKKQLFLTHYRESVYPHFCQIEEIVRDLAVYHLLLSRALFRDEEEKASWHQKSIALEQELDLYYKRADFLGEVRQSEKLSRGIEGSLADSVRNLVWEIELLGFNSASKRELLRRTELEFEAHFKPQESPLVAQLPEAIEKQGAIIANFHLGRLSGDEARKQLNENAPRSVPGYAQDVSERLESTMTELAVVRSELVATTDFASWAHYVLRGSADYFEPRFRTPERVLTYLEGLLNATDSLYDAILADRLSELGWSNTKWTFADLDLLRLPDAVLIRDFIRAEKIPELWKKAMFASGFSKEDVSSIHLDSEAREGRHASAYSFEVRQRRPRVLRVDARSLNIYRPKSDQSWMPSRVFVVQNLVNGKPSSLEVMFHEGGHSLDSRFREDLLEVGSSPSYDETLSTFWEYVLMDPRFFESQLRDKQDRRPSPETIEQYLRRSEVNRFIDMRLTIARAILEIRVWQEPFVRGGETYHQRVRRIFREVMQRALRVEEWPEGEIDYSNFPFQSDHLALGDLSYFGYVHAEIAAFHVTEALLDTLEVETGRRTFYQQPAIAEFLIEGFFKNGFQKPFPQSIRQFTGRAFQAASWIARVRRHFQAYQRERLNGATCEQVLDPT